MPENIPDELLEKLEAVLAVERAPDAFQNFQKMLLQAKTEENVQEIKELLESVLIQDTDPHFEEAKKAFNKAQKELKEELKNNEPYDLSEIEKIANEAIKLCEKAKSRDLGIQHLSLAIRKIDQIINNSKSAYYYLEQKKAIDDPQYYFDEVIQAENIRSKIEIKIGELQLGEPEAADIPHKPILTEVSPFVETSISEPQSGKALMRIKEVAEYIGISESTINHLPPYEAIPVAFIGTRKIYRKEDVDIWIRNKVENKSFKEKFHFIFTVPIEPYTKAFIEKGYLDEKNAILMNNRFSKEPKSKNDKIHWKGTIGSLMTFLYLSDRLGYISFSGKTRSRVNISNAIKESGVIDEKKEVESELPYYQFINQNFKIKGNSEGNLSKILLKINNALISLCKQISIKNNNQKTTRKNTILEYFKTNGHYELNIIKDEEIDIRMLEIMRQIHNYARE